MAKIIDHPVVKLKKQVEALEKRVNELEVDRSVLKDLLARTIAIVKKLDADRFKIPLSTPKKPK